MTPRQELQRVLSLETADEVLEHRAKIKKPLTAQAAKRLANQLEKMADPNAAAMRMIDRGWRGFEPGWAPDLLQKSTQGATQRDMTLRPTPEPRKDPPPPTPEQRERAKKKIDRLLYELSQNKQPINAAYEKRQADLRRKSERVRANLRHNMAGR